MVEKRIYTRKTISVIYRYRRVVVVTWMLYLHTIECLRTVAPLGESQLSVLPALLLGHPLASHTHPRHLKHRSSTHWPPVTDLYNEKEGCHKTIQILTFNLVMFTSPLPAREVQYRNTHSLVVEGTNLINAWSSNTQIGELWNKREGGHKAKQIFTFLCLTVQHSHHPSLAKERDSIHELGNWWAIEEERVATKQNKYSPSLV